MLFNVEMALTGTNLTFRGEEGGAADLPENMIYIFLYFPRGVEKFYFHHLKSLQSQHGIWVLNLSVAYLVKQIFFWHFPYDYFTLRILPNDTYIPQWHRYR